MIKYNVGIYCIRKLYFFLDNFYQIQCVKRNVTELSEGERLGMAGDFPTKISYLISAITKSCRLCLTKDE